MGAVEKEINETECNRRMIFIERKKERKKERDGGRER